MEELAAREPSSPDGLTFAPSNADARAGAAAIRRTSPPLNS